MGFMGFLRFDSVLLNMRARHGDAFRIYVPLGRKARLKQLNFMLLSLSLEAMWGVQVLN